LRDEMLIWSAPAVICALVAFPMRHRPLVRMCMAGGGMAMAAGAAAALTRSPVLARFPIPGTIFFHLMVGVFAHEAGILWPSTWAGRIRVLAAPMEQSAAAILQTIVVLVLVYFLVPQLYTIVRTPYLARPYSARIFHLEDKRLRVSRNLATLLRPVGENDVVLADGQTSWLVPSAAGKIVSAIHYELFVPNQMQRELDVLHFFTSDDERQREDCIRRYHVRWILLNPLYVPEPRFTELLRSAAVVGQADGLMLMEADRWIAAAPSQDPTRMAGEMRDGPVVGISP
jgi:hypothetical protein